MKEYHKYYKRSNMHYVLNKLEKSNYMCKDYIEPMSNYASEEDHAIKALKCIAPIKSMKNKW